MSARIPSISHSVTVVPNGSASAAVQNDEVKDNSTPPDPPGAYQDGKMIDEAVLAVDARPGFRVRQILCTLRSHVRYLKLGSDTDFEEWESVGKRSISIPYGEGLHFSSKLPAIIAAKKYAWDGREGDGHYYLSSDECQSIINIVVICEPTDGRPTVVLETGSTVGGRASPMFDADSGSPGSEASFGIQATPELGYRFVGWVDGTPGMTIEDADEPSTTVSYPFPSSGVAKISVRAKFESKLGPHPPPEPGEPTIYPPHWPVDPGIREYGYIVVRTSPNDSTMGSTEPGEIVYGGLPETYQTIRIVATANDGYSFRDWTDDSGSVVSTGEVYEQTLQFPDTGEYVYLTFTGNFFEPSGDQIRVIVNADTGPLVLDGHVKKSLAEWGAEVQPSKIEKYGYPGQTLKFDFIAYSDPKLGTWFREWNTKIDATGDKIGDSKSKSLEILVTTKPSPQEHEVYACNDSVGIVTVGCAFDGNPDKVYFHQVHCSLGQELVEDESGPLGRSVNLSDTHHRCRKAYTGTGLDWKAFATLRAWCVPKDGYSGVKVIEKTYYKDPDTGETTVDEYETPWSEDFEDRRVGFETVPSEPAWSGYLESEIIFVLSGGGPILHGSSNKILHGSSGSILHAG